MNKKIFKAIIAFALLAITTLNVNAQVTIGSDNEPEKAMLLQLKTREPNNPQSATDPENVTVNDASGGGLGLPRVILQDRFTLDPFVDSQSADWTGNIGKIKEKHAGLVVYNINVSPDSETRLNKIFQQGAYVWTGEEWRKVTDGSNHKRYFYMPAFNMELGNPDGTTVHHCNLYDEYARQFTRQNNSSFVSSNQSIDNIPTHESGRLYLPGELDYVVTYYDQRIITINRISALGDMEYTVNSLDLDANSYVSIIFVIR
jgi:hypothetical protein